MCWGWADNLDKFMLAPHSLKPFATPHVTEFLLKSYSYSRKFDITQLKAASTKK